jgi:hypothetical protein
MHQAIVVSTLVEPCVLEEGWREPRRREGAGISDPREQVVGTSGVDCIPQHKRPPPAGVELAKRYFEKLRGRRKKEYGNCSKDQQAQDRAWLLACAVSKPQLMHVVEDIINASADKGSLFELLLSYLDDSKVVGPCRTAMEARMHAAPHNKPHSSREVGLDVALALLFETGLSWNHYHTLTHIWRISTEKGDLRFPSKCRLYQHYKQMQTEVLTMPVVVLGEAAGNFDCRTAESGWEAGRERVQRVADAAYKAANGRFDPYLKGFCKFICNISADGFTVRNFVKEVIHFVRANVRVLLWCGCRFLPDLAHPTDAATCQGNIPHILNCVAMCGGTVSDRWEAQDTDDGHVGARGGKGASHPRLMRMLARICFFSNNDKHLAGCQASHGKPHFMECSGALQSVQKARSEVCGPCMVSLRASVDEDTRFQTPLQKKRQLVPAA